MTALIPTEEQEHIYSQIQKPSNFQPSSIWDKNNNEHIVRITAGAGAGKTTTVLNLAAKAAGFGHGHISYVTFSRAAAADGQRRISEMLEKSKASSAVGSSDDQLTAVVEARTLHSCAMKLLSDQRNEEFTEETEADMEGRLLDDAAFEKYVQTTLKNEINSFLSFARDTINARTYDKDTMSNDMRIVRAERQVLFYIRKTLDQFCRSPNSLHQFEDKNFRQRDYYPAKLFHTQLVPSSSSDGSRNNQPMTLGEKYGFLPGYYKSRIGWYADMAHQLYKTTKKENIRTYNLEMKRAQISKLRIPGSILLVDESQDMDGCQTEWMKIQSTDYGTHVYLVGDAAQTIYSFRGAKSKYMMGVPNAIDCQLTTSWRFGRNIANIANLVLLSKELSPQTTANSHAPIWKPYRLVGGGAFGDGVVTTESLLNQWENMKVTYIAATNANLLLRACDLFGMDPNQSKENEGEGEGEDDNYDSSECEENDEEINGKDNADDVKMDIQFPKIHINGKGENSGLKKWNSTVKQIQTIYDIYKSGDMATSTPLREFQGQLVTWKSFVSEVETREMNQYAAPISIVNKFRDKTLEAMALFKKEVMEKRHSADEADLIMTTAHSAKGMEWDNVQVSSDEFLDITVRESEKEKVPKKGGNGMRSSWEFKMKNWGDDVNVLYVACTRAKKLLSIPTHITSFIQQCDLLHNRLRSCKKIYDSKEEMEKSSQLNLFGIKDTFMTWENAANLYTDIVLPIRKQYELETKDLLMSALIQSTNETPNCTPESDYNDNKLMEVMEGDEQFESYFEIAPKKVKAVPSMMNAKPVKTEAKITPSPPLSPNPTLETQKPAAEKTKTKTKPVKKEKNEKIYQVIQQANDAYKLAPPGTVRAFDRHEKAPTGRATCKQCGELIREGLMRIGVQVYNTNRNEFWASWFHSKCVPRNAKKLLIFDPNPPAPKPKAKKRSSSGWGYSKGGYGGGGGYKQFRRY